MEVVFAYYGVSCADHKLTINNLYESTEFAATECDKKAVCSGIVNMDVLGDPYPKCNKDFIVVAVCTNGNVVSERVSPPADNEEFHLTCGTSPVKSVQMSSKFPDSEDFVPQ
jgi:hypothetical protein